MDQLDQCLVLAEGPHTNNGCLRQMIISCVATKVMVPSEPQLQLWTQYEVTLVSQ